MTIRPARKGEAKLLTALAIRSKAIWGYSPDFMRACEAELTIDEEALDSVFVKVHEDEVVGLYSLQKLSGECVELQALFVEPNRLRRSYGTELLEDARRRARAGGYRTMVIQGDPNAAAFYRFIGAIQVGERESESVPGRMLPLFELVL
jgi:N-acetylglutamate synthase-like GNAT family acetyltransferase